VRLGFGGGRDLLRSLLVDGTSKKKNKKKQANQQETKRLGALCGGIAFLSLFSFVVFFFLFYSLRRLILVSFLLLVVGSWLVALALLYLLA
jgi:glucan phosphoethanolaminetransferase (alkaline phosphatase superfamily)